MHSQPPRGEASRRPAAARLKSTTKPGSKTPQGDTALRRAEAEKTARLRVLRLQKEAADKDEASRDAAAASARKRRLQRRAAGPQASTSSEPK